MSSNKPLMLDPGMCRCCKSIKKCRLLTSEHEWMGNKEVYSDMMMDCFGLLLSHLDGDTKERGVCATCVVRLREACAFRKQVLQCEETFLQAKINDNYDDNKNNIVIEIKSEPPECSDVDEPMELNDSSSDEDFSESARSTLKKKKIKSIKRVVVKRRFRSDISDTAKKINKGEVRVTATYDIRRNTKEAMASDLALLKNKLNNTLKRPYKKKELILKPKLDADLRDYIRCNDEQYLSEDNMITIIENSYIYPFRNRINNYYCFYCKDYCSKPEELRNHTWSHDPNLFKTMFKKGFHYVDITRIDCRLCSDTIDDLDVFKKHLSEVHKKKMHFDIPDRFIQFRLSFNDLACLVCGQTYVDFSTIEKHMVEHFSNFTCDVCGLSFLEESRLSVHMRSHKPEEKHPCEVCGKIFKSKFYKDNHVDTVHNKIPTVHCPKSKCLEMFLSYTQRNRHLLEVHGVQRSFSCNVCDKVYKSNKSLSEHHRRTHLKVLKHRCEYCDQRFFLPSRLKEHMATHTGVRNVYRCDSCDKSYPRLKSLQEHVRTHSEERRFRCHVCGQGFVQNVSLKNHLKSQHQSGCEMGEFY